MKRVFFFGVIAYSVAIFVLNDLAGAVNNTGTGALPWMVKCLIDILFVGAGTFSMFGNVIQWDDDEVGIHAEDVKVPDTWLYGLFGINLLLNFGWHGYEFAVLSGVESLYNGAWFFIEFVAMFLTTVFFRHARDVALRDMRRKAQDRSAPRSVA